MRKKTLVLGPLPPPFGGQAVITEYVIGILGNTYVINTNTIYRNPFLVNVISIVKILKSVLRWSSFSHVYVSLSRGKLSSLKDLLVIMLCVNSPKKVIGHLHGNDLNYLESKGLYGYFLRLLYRRIDTCIYVTDYQRSLYPLFAAKSIVIPNVVVNLWNTEIICSKSTTRLLYVSLLMYSKGFLILLEAFVAILRKGYKLNLDVAGAFDSDEHMSSSDFREIVLERISAVNVEFGSDTVVYHGEVIGESKKRLFEVSDIFVFPTFFKSESFGLVLVEAMMSGCVIIASNEPFFKEIILEGNYFFEKCSVKSLTDILEIVVNHEDLSIQKSRNVRYARDKFSIVQFENSIRNEFV